MQIYDKLIVDTSNIFYRVAAFYLKDLSQDSAAQLMKNNTVFNYYKSAIQTLKQQTLGKVCLLFDPLLSNGNMSERLKIKEGYKATRDKNTPTNKLRIDTLEKLYSYFIVDPQKDIEVYHDITLEADDFVAKLTESGKCLMITSDEDFCRYLESGRVEMLNQGLTIKDSSIFTAEDFEKKHGFKPTITSVIFWKAIFGDVSDNIVGSFKDPSTKVIVTASDEMMKLIKSFGEENTDLAEVKSEFFAGNGRFKRLKDLLILSNTDRSFEKLLNMTDDNFKVIESKLPRNSSIPIENYKIKLDFNIKKPNKKFSLSKPKEF